MFQSNAIYLLLVFAVIYVAAHILVTKHPYFAEATQLKRSLITKVIAVVLFALVAMIFA